jgi:ABC-type bacteriocin/lantibiotic exporter with double-glycine peptidase domain
MRRPRAVLWLALLWVSASGCYTGGARTVSPQRASALAADPSWTFVPDVPFIAQQSDSDCGPAALAMVLAHFGVPASLAEVVAADPPRDGGVRAGDLRDVARAKGLSAFVVAGTFADLFEQLGRGRPVLVGLAKPMTGGRALAHYEVVVAIDRRDRRLLTLDPARGLSENSLEDFAREWAPTGQVTLIVFRPGSVDRKAS